MSDSLRLHGNVQLALETSDFKGKKDGVISEEYVEHSNKKKEGPWWKARDTFVLLTFLGVTVCYTVRVCLSIAIVAMVNRNETTNASQQDDTCPVPDDEDTGNTVIVGEFDWSEGTVAVMLSAFFYGYTATNFVGGRAAEYFGGRVTFGLGVLLPSILSLLSPLCVHTSEYLFIALRVLEGMTQAVVFPSLHFMIAAWVPPKDKAKYGSMISSGIQVGTVVAMSFGGWLCSSSYFGGWPAPFYVFGGLGVVWAIPWFLLAYNLPEDHPSISDSELEYIKKHRYFVKRDKAVDIPWREIAKSRPFWAIVMSSFCYNFSFYTLLTELPTFFHNILHFDMNKNALGSALPYMLQGITCVGWGLLVDVLLQRNFLSVNRVRKLSTGIALYSSGACLIAMMWVKCNAVLAVVVMCLAVGLMGPINSGSTLSEQDIAPNLAGSLKGLTNTVGSATGFLAPAVTAAIITDNQTLSAWNTVFLISAVFNLFFCTMFLILGTDKVQHWNYPKEKKISISVISSHDFEKNED